MSKLQAFKDEMNSNPLGSNQRVRQVGDYIVEYYPDSFSLSDEPRPRMQAFRERYTEDEHWRQWKMISDFEDFDGDLEELFNTITVQELRERDE